MDLPWDKLDVVTFSWQKALGGEAAHGVLVLSPNAVRRLETYVPTWPMPKLFRMTASGKLNEGIFVGDTINTPSMLCVEDIIDALTWAREAGGLKELIRRSKANLAVLEKWVGTSEWAEFLADKAEYRSNTSVCLAIRDPWFASKSAEEQKALIKKIVKLLGDEGVGYDLGAYKDAPAGLRVWCGATVEASDVEALCPWLDWAWQTVKAEG